MLGDDGAFDLSVLCIVFHSKQEQDRRISLYYLRFRMFYIIVCLEKATVGSESKKSATINIVGSDTISTLATNMGYKSELSLRKYDAWNQPELFNRLKPEPQRSTCRRKDIHRKSSLVYHQCRMPCGIKAVLSLPMRLSTL